MQRAVETAVLACHHENATLLLEAMARGGVKPYYPYEDMLLSAMPTIMTGLPVMRGRVRAD